MDVLPPPPQVAPPPATGDESHLRETRIPPPPHSLFGIPPAPHTLFDVPPTSHTRFDIPPPPGLDGRNANELHRRKSSDWVSLQKVHFTPRRRSSAPSIRNDRLMTTPPPDFNAPRNPSITKTPSNPSTSKPPPPKVPKPKLRISVIKKSSGKTNPKASRLKFARPTSPRAKKSSVTKSLPSHSSQNRKSQKTFKSLPNGSTTPRTNTPRTNTPRVILPRVTTPLSTAPRANGGPRKIWISANVNTLPEKRTSPISPEESPNAPLPGIALFEQKLRQLRQERKEASKNEDFDKSVELSQQINETQKQLKLLKSSMTYNGYSQSPVHQNGHSESSNATKRTTPPPELNPPTQPPPEPQTSHLPSPGPPPDLLVPLPPPDISIPEPPPTHTSIPGPPPDTSPSPNISAPEPPYKVSVPAPPSSDIPVPAPLPSDISVPASPPSDLSVPAPPPSDISVPEPPLPDVSVPDPPEAKHNSGNVSLSDGSLVDPFAPNFSGTKSEGSPPNIGGPGVPPPNTATKPNGDKEAPQNRPTEFKPAPPTAPKPKSSKEFPVPLCSPEGEPHMPSIKAPNVPKPKTKPPPPSAPKPKTKPPPPSAPKPKKNNQTSTQSTIETTPNQLDIQTTPIQYSMPPPTAMSVSSGSTEHTYESLSPNVSPPSPGESPPSPGESPPSPGESPPSPGESPPQMKPPNVPKPLVKPPPPNVPKPLVKPPPPNKPKPSRAAMLPPSLSGPRPKIQVDQYATVSSQYNTQPPQVRDRDFSKVATFPPRPSQNWEPPPPPVSEGEKIQCSEDQEIEPLSPRTQALRSAHSQELKTILPLIAHEKCVTFSWIKEHFAIDLATNSELLRALTRNPHVTADMGKKSLYYKDWWDCRECSFANDLNSNICGHCEASKFKPTLKTMKSVPQLSTTPQARTKRQQSLAKRSQFVKLQLEENEFEAQYELKSFFTNQELDKLIEENRDEKEQESYVLHSVLWETFKGANCEIVLTTKGWYKLNVGTKKLKRRRPLIDIHSVRESPYNERAFILYSYKSNSLMQKNKFRGVMKKSMVFDEYVQKRTFVCETADDRYLWVLTLQRLISDIWQQLLESTLMPKPEIYQALAFVMKVNSRGIFQERALIFSNSWIYNVEIVHNPTEVKNVKWVLPIYSVEKIVEQTHDGLPLLELHIISGRAKEMLKDRQKTKRSDRKVKTMYKFVFPTEQLCEIAVTQLERLYMDLTNECLTVCLDTKQVKLIRGRSVMKYKAPSVHNVPANPKMSKLDAYISRQNKAFG